MIYLMKRPPFTKIQTLVLCVSQTSRSLLNVTIKIDFKYIIFGWRKMVLVFDLEFLEKMDLILSYKKWYLYNYFVNNF